jgi:sugar lactone lactonase YvrE
MAEIFATGIQMGESARWHDGRLWMCDWLAGEVLAFDSDGRREVVARVDGLPFSIDWLPDGRMVTTTRSGVVVGAELAPYGAAGRPFNEIVVDGAGRTWVDMPGAMPWEEPRPGIVGVVLPDGSYHQVDDDVWFPNGMAILGDDTLVVAESHADRLTAWTITPGGELVDRRVWADVGEAPDGSARMPKGPSGTRPCRVSAVSALPRVAACWRPSRPTVAASRACSAATTVRRSTSSPTATAKKGPRTASY